MRLVTTVAKTAKGKWEILAPFGDDIEHQVEIYKAMVLADGVVTQGDKEKKYSEIYVLDSRRPYKRRKFR